MDNRIFSAKKAWVGVGLILLGCWSVIRKDQIFSFTTVVEIDSVIIVIILILAFLSLGKGFSSIIIENSESAVLNTGFVKKEKQVMRKPFKIMFAVVALCFLLVILGSIIFMFKYVL